MYWSTGKLNLFLFILDTCLKKPGSNETLTSDETMQSLTSEDYLLTSMIDDLKNQNTISSLDVSRIGKEMTVKQTSQIIFYILKENLGKKRRVFYPRSIKSGPGCIMMKLKIKKADAMKQADTFRYIPMTLEC